MRALTLLVFACSTLPAAAAETAWQEIAPDTRLRLVSSDVLKADGTTMMALELDLPPDTKTYWRVPGETGIPTEIDTAGSRGVTGHEMFWPYPTIEVSGGLTDFVYRGPTVLPFQLQLDGAQADLALSVIMGVCSDICVPAMASFALPLDFDTPDRGHGLRIAQAIARAPQPWAETPPLGPVTWNEQKDAISVLVADPRVEPMSLIADASAAGQLFGAPQKSPDGSAVLLPLLGGAHQAAQEGMPVSLIFMTEMGPFSLSTTVGR